MRAFLVRVLAAAAAFRDVVIWLFLEMSIQFFLASGLLLKDDFLDGGDTLPFIPRVLRTVSFNRNLIFLLLLCTVVFPSVFASYFFFDRLLLVSTFPYFIFLSVSLSTFFLVFGWQNIRKRVFLGVLLGVFGCLSPFLLPFLVYILYKSFDVGPIVVLALQAGVR